MARHERQKGLTLVETLVAMAILAFVVAAIMALSGQGARFVASAQDRLLAGVAADNAMVEALAVSAPLERGETESELEIAGTAFLVRRNVIETGAATLVRIELSVANAATGQVLATASTLKAEAGQ